MKGIPRSSSQSFYSGRKVHKKQNKANDTNVQRNRKIKIERTKSTSTAAVMTPADITTSYKPRQQVKIEHTIKRSISFTRDGQELNLTPSNSMTNIAESAMPESPSIDFPIKEIYSVEDMLAMKPQKFENELRSAGFISLHYLYKSKSKSNDHNPKRKKMTRSKSSQLGQPVLRAHGEDRFVSSAETKGAGMYDEHSAQVIRTHIQRILNRLNSKNIDSNINAVKKYNISREDLIQLLLDRATMDTESPEKNVQLGNFILFAIKYSNENPLFASNLIQRSYETANSLVGQQQNVPIPSFQCITVWLSALFKAGMGEEHELYDFLNNVMINEPKERAIDVLRSGLYILGDRAGPNFNIFFEYLGKEKSQYGYKRFLVEDLLALRENGWKNEETVKKEDKPSLHIELNKKELQSKEDPHDVDNADIIEGEYNRWLKEEEFEFTKFQPDAIVRLTLRVIIKHFRDANTFVQYAASILSNSSKDNGRIVDIIKDYYPIFAENVRVEENPNMWNIYFMLLGSYFAEEIIKFDLIQELILRANETEFPPRMKLVVFRMAEITGVPIDKVMEFKEAVGEPTKSDPEFNQALVALADYTLEEGESEEECGKKSIIHAGIIVRDIIAAALQDDVTDPEGMILEKKELLMKLFELYGRNMISVAKHVIKLYQLDLETKNRLVNFIENGIFESE